MGKGSKKRPRQISLEESDLRWEYFQGFSRMTEVEFKERVKIIRKKMGKP